MVKDSPDAAHIKEVFYRDFRLKGTMIINQDLTLTVDGEVNAQREMSQLRVQFASVTHSFNCSGIGLTSLKGCPHIVGRKFNCEHNLLTNLMHGPQQVKSYAMRDNPLTSLEGLPAHIPEFVLFTFNEHLPLLRTLAAKEIWPYPDQPELEKILTKYAQQGRPGAIKCAAELIRAGYKENARW